MAAPKVDRKEFTERAGNVIAIAAAVVLILLLLWYAANVLMLVFAGVLLAVILRTLADLVARYTPLSPGWSLALIVALLVGVLGATVWLYGPQMAQGIYDFVSGFPNALRDVFSYFEQWPWGQRLLSYLDSIDWSAVTPDIARRVFGIFSTALPALGGVLVVIFLGLYLSAEPRTYIDGVVRLVPIAKRRRARDVLRRLGYVLKWIMLGRLLSMIALFALTWLGLALLGVPHAFSLALLAGLLEFIPNIGPIIAALPAVTVGLSESPTLAVWVIALYLFLQTLESYFVTPLIQREMMSVPPALLFMVQLVMGVLFGVIGLLLAEAMTAVLMVLVKMLYIEDVLESNP